MVRSDLNPDLLAEILRRSSREGGLRSHMTFSRVCRSWRDAAAANPYKPVVPWLMFSKLEDNQKTRSFFGFDDEKTHVIKFSDDDANSSWCSGSSEGWLAMTHTTSGTFLYNPITGDRINLPILDFVPYRVRRCNHLREYSWVRRPVLEMYLNKVIVVTSSSLSSSRGSSFNYHHYHSGIKHDDIVAVAAIFEQSNFMGFCRPGDKKWQIYTHPHIPKPKAWRVAECTHDFEIGFLDQVIDDDETAEHKRRTEKPMFHDVILYRGALYAITQHTAVVGVFKFDNSGGGTSSRVIPEIHWLNMQPMKIRMTVEDSNYLVESCDGELLMVVRRHTGPSGGSTKEWQRSIQTTRFLVFKLDESSDPMRWVRIKSLGDQILFLGSSHSKSFRACDIPGARSGNCIYFTTDMMWRHLWLKETSWPKPSSSYMCKDTGVFYLEDGRVESSRSLFTHDSDGRDLAIRTPPPSTIEYPAIFITPNPLPLPSSSSFTNPQDNRISSKCLRRFTYPKDNHISKCWRRYAAISAILVAGTVILGGSALDFLKLLPPLPPPSIKVYYVDCDSK